MLSGCHPNKISVTMNRSRPLLFVLDFLAGLTFGQTADRPSDPAPAEYTFRFVAGDGMFYTPRNGPSLLHISPPPRPAEIPFAALCL